MTWNIVLWFFVVLTVFNTSVQEFRIRRLERKLVLAEGQCQFLRGAIDTLSGMVGGLYVEAAQSESPAGGDAP